MNETVEFLIQKGNTAFLAGNREDAILCYFNALEKAGALETVLRYIKKNKENLSVDQLMLQELLYKKYGIRFVYGALPSLLFFLKNQMETFETTKAYERFKKIIRSKYPRTPEQYIDVFLENFENHPIRKSCLPWTNPERMQSESQVDPRPVHPYTYPTLSEQPDNQTVLSRGEQEGKK